MKKIYISIAFTAVMSVFANAQNYAFTNAGATGVAGPSQLQLDAAYTGTDLDGMVTVVGQGIQEWVVPTTGAYTITGAGASGGYTPAALGGSGREITIEVNLTAGDVLRVLVGQEGGRADFASPGWCGGGGGGSFVINQTSGAPILICGGGGGAGQGSASWGSPVLPGVNASPYNVQSGTDGTGYNQSWSTNGIGGTSGNGGTASAGGGGGGGYLTNGGFGSYSGYPGIAYQNGGLGGLNRDACSGGFLSNIPGGFGGGAGAGICSNYEANGGGGGGYSGGGGSNTRAGAGGGGGNFYTGTYISDGLNTGDGYVTIVPVCFPLVTSISAIELCDGEEVTVSATSSLGGVVSWDNGVANNVPFSPSLGSVTYTATSDNIDDCPFSVDIVVYPNPAVNAGVDIVLCDGIVDTTLNAIGTADQFTWSNGVLDGVSFTPTLGTTQYVLTGTNFAGSCTITDTLLLTAGSPAITLASNDELFGNDGSIILTIDSGMAPFTFDWDNDGVGDNDDNNDLYGLAAGTYTVIMTDASGCTASATIVVDSQLGLEELGAEFKLYPNPVVDVMILEYHGSFTYQLLNLAGEEVMAGQGEGKSTLTMNTLSAGAYVLKIQTMDSSAAVKVVKQ